MDKVTEFLERYVQWVALGIAALFLIYAVYSYMPGLNQPVTVEVGANKLSPGEADSRIYTDVAAPLESDINANSARLPNVTIPAYGTQVKERIGKPTTAPALPPTAFASRQVELPTIDWDAKIGNLGNQDLTKVRQLPTLPAAILMPDPTTGFAQVDPNNTPNGVTGGGASADGGVTATGMPVSPARAAGNAAAQRGTATQQPTATAAPAGQSNTVDVTWVRVPFTIPTARLVQAFREANLPAEWSKTAVLRVELIRQKQLPDGNWSPEEVVAPLPFLKLEPMPGQSADLATQQAYITWASAHQTDLLQPPFFNVIAGDNPTLEPPVVEQEVDNATFDPSQYPAGVNISMLTGEQKLQVAAYRKQQEDARRQAAGQNTPRPRPTRGGGGAAEGGGGRTVRQPRPQPQPRPEVVATPQPEARPAYVAPPPGPAIVLSPVPSAPFNPAETQADIQGVAYDITGATEATYHYRVRYSLQNPIFASQNVAEPQSLAQQFALVGEDKETWSTPVTIAPLTHIYVAQALNPAPNAIVRFNVYRWQAGHWQMTTTEARSGDSIGKQENGVDFRTPWTVVEVRNDSSSSQRYVLLMNADGTLRKQEYDKDNNSPEQARFKAQVEASNPQAAGGGAAGGRGGMGGTASDGPTP